MRITWTPEDRLENGVYSATSASGAGWQAVVKRAAGSGWQAALDIGGNHWLLWPERDEGITGKSEAACKSWVSRTLKQEGLSQ